MILIVAAGAVEIPFEAENWNASVPLKSLAGRYRKAPEIGPVSPRLGLAPR